MVSLLLYLATIAYIPVVVGVFSVFFIRKRLLKEYLHLNTNLFLIILIISLIILNRFFWLNFNVVTNVRQQLFPSDILIIFMYFIALTFDLKNLRILIYLILFESFFVIIESLFGFSSIFPEFYYRFSSTDLLYFRRALGLSTNSSEIALKLLLAIILLYRYNIFSKKRKKFILIIFLLALFFSFNRTAIISVIILFMLIGIKRSAFNKKTLKIILFLAVVTFIMLQLGLFKLFDTQITVNRTNPDAMLTGRVYIWAQFFNFFKHHILLGNNSIKFKVNYYGVPAHAHSSYLEILAIHGIIISFLFIFLIIRNINKNNYVYVIPILIYSITQYGIFTSFSITDIVLYILLFNKNIDYELSLDYYEKYLSNSYLNQTFT